MDKKITFLIYCMERYRYFKKLSGKEVVALFEKYKVNDYIIRYFEALHVFSDACIVQDIDEYIGGCED